MVTGQIVVEEFRQNIDSYGPPASTLTDNGLVFTTRVRNGPNAFENELRLVDLPWVSRTPSIPLSEREAGARDAIAAQADAVATTIAGADDAGVRVELDGVLARGQVTAVIASSTPLATIALDAMTAAGLRTPEDLAFATFDGFDQHPMFSATLTTIRQPAFDIGRAAVQLLQARIDDATSTPETRRLTASLDLQDSTEAYAGTV